MTQSIDSARLTLIPVSYTHLDVYKRQDEVSHRLRLGGLFGLRKSRPGGACGDKREEGCAMRATILVG